jgi:hypothetical protein
MMRAPWTAVYDARHIAEARRPDRGRNALAENRPPKAAVTPG